METVECLKKISSKIVQYKYCYTNEVVDNNTPNL